MTMKTYNVALVEGVDYDAFWKEIETDGSGSVYVPSRSVDIVNERPSSLRQCWYELSDAEAEKLRKDSRVYCVEIPPEFRDDIQIGHCSTQSGLYYKTAGTNPANNYGINWGLFRLNSSTNNTTSSSSGTLNYDFPLDGTGVDFVLTDSGCQIDHPEFTDANGVSRVQQINWFTASGVSGTMPSFSTFYTDNDGHGTHCTGIAAGKTYGRAKNAKIYVMSISGLTISPTVGISYTSAFDCIKGWHLNKAIDPATGYRRPTVVNMSWTFYNTFSNLASVNYRGVTYPISGLAPQYGMITSYYCSHVSSVDVDIAELIAAGVVLVGAAGNYYQICDDVGGVDYNNYYTDTYGSSDYYMRGGSPVCNPGVIVVGSVDSVYQSGTTEQKKGYSNSGPRIDVFAPGTDIVSTTSNTNRFGAVTQYPFNSSYKIMSISGTSMASPNVAGLAAQLLQVYPHATPQQIRQKIIDISASNVLYSTGLTNDYTNYSSLHGAPNRYAFQPYNTATNSGVTGAVTVQNASIRG